MAHSLQLDLLALFPKAINEKKRIDIQKTFISDTITAPTPGMYEYATIAATLGDDVYSEPSTAALEAHIASLTGKQAGLFLPSGTASNQIAIRSHLGQPPYTVLCDARAHIYKYEAGGTAFHSGAAVSPILPSNGHHLTLDDIKDHIVYGPDVHFAPTVLISLENTLNGTIFPQDAIQAISTFAHSKGIKMHLDGARLWHVAAETNLPLNDLCAPFDSVSLCFSKGLGAPIGSVLVGSHSLITKARRFRKLFGGGMRQTGFIAASAVYALNNHYALLPHVHALTKELEKGLEELGATITSRAETCMVFYDPAPIGLDYDEIAKRGETKGLTLGGSRLVVHIQTSEEAIKEFLDLIKEMKEEKLRDGWVWTGEKAKVVDVYVRRST